MQRRGFARDGARANSSWCFLALPLPSGSVLLRFVSVFFVRFLSSPWVSRSPSRPIPCLASSCHPVTRHLITGSYFSRRCCSPSCSGLASSSSSSSFSSLLLSSLHIYFQTLITCEVLVVSRCVRSLLCGRRCLLLPGIVRRRRGDRTAPRRCHFSPGLFSFYSAAAASPCSNGYR